MPNILGINLSDLTVDGVKNKIDFFLKDIKPHYLVTPNPEIILQARKDEELFYILNKADLAIADGFGLKVAGWFNGLNITRLTGSDLTLYLLELAQKLQIKITILNWSKGLSTSSELSTVLKNKYPNLIFLNIDIDREITLPSEIIKRVNEFSPKILFNNLGAPFQEKLIYYNLTKFSSVRLAAGIGGSFDFITGKIKRAPYFFRFLGLEWLWRLIKQPKKRGRRIFNAVFVFTGCIFQTYINHFFYRKSVACLLYKYEGGVKKILLVEREDEKNHWQLPQGNTDGETIEIAGARELREELNTDKFKTKASFKKLYSYLFQPIVSQRSLPGDKRLKALISNYKGKRQGLYIAEFLGDNQDIKLNYWDHDNWKWVDEKDFINSVHLVRRASAQIYLEKLKSLDLK